MNPIVKYFERRIQNRFYTTMAIYGSCHVQTGLRRKWSPLRLIFGDLHYKFIHPGDVACKCDWTSEQMTTVWDRFGRDKV